MPDITSLSDDDLINLLHEMESDRVERKRNFSDGDKIRQAVCAFANDLPGHKQAGVLFVGAEDNGAPSGITVTDELLRNLSDIARDGNTLPLPVMKVEKRRLDGADMAVVTVMPSDMPPVKFNGRIWIRIGPRRAVANEQEERILVERRQSKIIPFDISPVYTAKLADLSRGYFEDDYLPTAFSPDVLAQNHRTYEERLASLRMIVSPENTTPTFTGLLALGKDPQYHLFGAYIQFLRIDGLQLGDPVIDETRGTGNLRTMINTIITKFEAHNRRSYVMLNGQHLIKEDYPPEAVKQLLYNAVQHRSYDGTNAPIHVYWYNDRIEITSPGGPFGRVTPENFGRAGIVDYRNPTLSESMKTLDIIQHFGQGINTAREAMKRNGNPPIEFKADQNWVNCVLWGKKPGDV